MKKLLFLFAVSIVSVTCFSQKLSAAKVPQAVKDGLKKAHPAAAATWEMEDANYEANFKESGKTMSCVIDKRGTILETETETSLSGLPQTARTYIDAHYKGKRTKEIAKIEKAGGQSSYEVVFSNGKEVLFDANGNFKEVEKKEKREKD